MNVITSLLGVSAEGGVAFTAPLRIDVEQQNDVCVLRCSGRFVPDLDEEYVRTRIRLVKELNCKKVVADFHDVPCVGSSGLGFLVAVYTSVVRDGNGRFILASAAPLVKRALEITNLSRLIPLAADLDSALAALQGRSLC